MKKTDFKPAWWLPGCHLQTLWPSLRRRKIDLPLARERIWLEDGDFLDLDWTEGNVGAPIVLILHGLEGSINSKYAKGMLKALQKASLRGVFMHFRGCSGESNKTPRAYHAGETNDLAFVLKKLKEREPFQKMAAIGYSLGGNVLLKYLGETREDNPLSCAVAISVPFQLNRSSSKMQKGFSTIYQNYLLSQLRKKIREKAKCTKLPVDLETLYRVKTFWEFDHLFTAKMHGFKDAKDYYDQSSCFSYLSRIEKKTLIIHARNDPFLPPDAIPDPQKLPDNVQLELHEYGGHVGFMEGSLPWRPEYWLERRVPSFLQEWLLETAVR